MPLKLTLDTTRTDHRIAWLTALAISIHLFESVIPMPLPGVKPGLANVVTIVVLCKYGWRDAAWVSLLRVIVGSLILGTFLSPTFAMSLGGSLCSLAIIGVGRWLPGQGLGPVGYSLLAALGHMAGQFWLAYILFIPHPALWRLFPVMMSIALVLGVINGIISLMLLKRLS